MIIWDDEKNQKLQNERGISFDEISKIILRKEYLNILENPSRPAQQLFVVEFNKGDIHFTPVDCRYMFEYIGFSVILAFYQKTCEKLHQFKRL